jgi:hypothetical protein
VLRASAVKTARFPESIRHGEDIVFFSHLLMNTPMTTLATIPVDVYYHADSLRHQDEMIFKEADLLVDLLFDSSIFPDHILAYRNQYQARHLVSLAYRALKADKRDLAKTWIKQAINLDYIILTRSKTLKTLIGLYL